MLRLVIKISQNIIFILVAFYGLSEPSFAQDTYEKTPQQKVDSIEAILPKLKKEALAKAYTDLCWYYRNISLEKAKSYGIKALELSLKLEDKKSIAQSYNDMAIIYQDETLLDSAIAYNEIALKIREELGDSVNMAASLLKLGMINQMMGNLPEALNYQLKALNIYENLGSQMGISYSINNIAIIYNNMNNDEMALKYHGKALQMRLAMNDEYGIAGSYVNISTILMKSNQIDTCLVLHKKAIEIYEKMGEKQQLAGTLNNIGTLLQKIEKTDEALYYINKSLEIRREINDKKGLASSLNNIADIYLTQKKYKQAEELVYESIKYANEAQAKPELRMAYKILSNLYYQTGKHKDAYNYSLKYAQVNDSILNETSSQQLNEMEVKYEVLKKDKQIAILNKNKIINESRLEQQNTLLASIAGGLLLFFTLSIVIFKSYKRKKKDNAILSSQKLQIEEKNKEILSSITYAKTIQESILPNPKMVKEYIKNSFIIFKPKDIVSGDFYWMEIADDNTILFAAVDCTGHGVPGAFMSLIANSGLNKAVKENKLRNPSEILDFIDDFIKKSLRLEGKEVKDGMDIALCSLNFDGENAELQFSGAYNPLWLIKNGEFSELKADRQSVGDSIKPFTHYKISLQKNDMLFIFTDGYADQFGGANSKKFGYKALKDKILETQNKNMNDIQSELIKTFEDWKGNEEQVDDVCFIGIRV